MPRLSKIGAAALAAFGWTGLSSVTADFLVIAGGGGGGTNVGGGGGAGGYRTSAGTSGGGASAEGKLSLNPTLSYTVTVGAGGTGGSGEGGNGGNSVFSTITSVGGGGGGAAFSIGKNGGSGGGDSSYVSTGGSGTANQGFNGGRGANAGGTIYPTGGGGGAGAVGADGVSGGASGNGGNGVASSITGSSVTYAGGGGGGSYNNTRGTGGSGGGGNGGTDANAGTAGTANLGAGGGGGGTNSGAGGQGGSGVVIISYVGAQQFGGGVVTSSGGNTIHTFNTSGTLSPLSSLTASYLIVAGGAGTCGRGGAGAGGLLSGSGVTIDTNSIYLVTVGAGGTGTAGGSTASAVGSNSAFSMVTTTAVGGGSGGTTANTNGASGGSGGGGAVGTGTGGAGTSGQGNAGGAGGAFSGNYTSGGGGGAGAAGQAGQSGAGGAGGVGVSSSISGTATFYAGGGGGHADTSASGAGGNGGGGAGALGDANGTNGTANTGGGAGGSNPSTKFAQGGSGIVIISYAGSTQLMAGGTVTVAGGNVIHTFTSSGYLTPIVLVNNSLRFRQSASASLTRTPTASGNQQRFTLSFWMKYSALTSDNNLFSFGTSTTFLVQFVDGGRQLYVTTQQIGVTNVWGGSVPPLIRDPAAWYHFVIAIDTTQATAANRVLIYINGVAYTFSGTSPTQNYNAIQNPTTTWRIGARVDGNAYTDGYMTEINFVDGQQLTPNSFGTSNGLGVWQPIRYGGSYGTNGFYLPFNNSGALTANYLVVAGGGGGATTAGAGGGGGGLLTGTTTLNAGLSYSVTVGNGGAGGTFDGASGATGSNSVFNSVTATGGGGGSHGSTGGSGGSGGGAGYGTNSGGTGTVGQGNNGGSTSGTGSPNFACGGGGGAGAAGGNASGSTGGNGGAGTASSISGSSVTYAGGGGGSGAGGTLGGSGGGGAGGTISTGRQNGTANTGGGGGGGGVAADGLGNGGSGIVIVSYAGSAKFTGGTITSAGGNTIHTFTTSGTLNGIGSDYSPNGNNWTANNFSFSSGSTYDSMTDVPTLTSATVANYCVWNPLAGDTSKITLSNGNLNAQGTAQSCSIGGTMAMPTGKWYWESTITKSNIQQVGLIAVTLLGMNNSVVAGDSAGGYIYLGNGAFYNNGSTSLSGSSYTTNDVISVAFDADSGKLWFAKNGVWQNSGVPASGTGQVFTVSSSYTYIPVASAGGGTDQVGQTTNWGQQPFVYTAPSGFLPLNTFNLPTPTIGATASTTANKYFDVSLYTGNGSTQTITNSSSMQPDFVWTKSRSAAYNHALYDSVRGVEKWIGSNVTNAEISSSIFLSSFNSNGFSLGGASAVSNNSGETYVGWQWRASNTTAVTNTNGSIISTVSANTTAGFSIVTYTGNGTNSTVGHGLGVAPKMIIWKNRNATASWVVWHTNFSAIEYIYLNLTNAVSSSGGNAVMNSTLPTSSVFSLGTYSDVNGSGNGIVAYCFAPVAGYSAFGSYTGNGSTDGPFIFTGFRPRYVLIKRTDASEDWIVMDSARNTYNVANSSLFPNGSFSETTDSNRQEDFLSNGFKIRSSGVWLNASGGTFIYMAFAETPLKFSNAR